MSECPICNHDHYAVCMERVTAGGVEVTCGCREDRPRPRLVVRPAQVAAFPPPVSRGRLAKRVGIGGAAALGLVALANSHAALGLTVGLAISAASVWLAWLFGGALIRHDILNARAMWFVEPPGTLGERLMVGTIYALMGLVGLMVGAGALWLLTALGMAITGTL